jgi:hypothetical protein
MNFLYKTVKSLSSLVISASHGHKQKIVALSLHSLCEMKMYRRAFVSKNRMKAGHSSLKASLNRFNIVSSAEFGCGVGLQTEEHIFWDCKLYEEQRATVMDIHSV